MVKKDTKTDDKKIKLDKKDLENIDKLIEEVDLDSLDLEDITNEEIAPSLQKDSK
jgi:uncharacterized protein YlaN (UPF0358 family)